MSRERGPTRKRPAGAAARPAAAASKVARPARGVSLLWLAPILALTAIAYVPSLDNGFTNWDDNFYVTENPLLARPDARTILTTPVAGNYHPLTIASLALNHRISGLD